MVIAERGDNNKHAHKNIIEMKQQQTEWKKQVFTLELVTVITCSVNVILSRHTVWATKKFPFFETRYRATVNLRSCSFPLRFTIYRVFIGVSILKARREEQLKNGKKNGGKTVQKNG